jgi:homogentisate 1,2-dioxygenase
MSSPVKSSVKPQYQSGFGSEFASEALVGALPQGQNSPQANPFGLYGEQLTGTAFTAPRAANKWTWTYRIRPSAMHKPFREIGSGLMHSGPFNEARPTPNQMRWRPMPVPKKATDFLAGIVTLGGNGDPGIQAGVGIHLYAANQSMKDRFFYDADGELLIVPQLGSVRFHTEMGILELAPGEFCVIPRGVKFRVELVENAARGYICENYGAHFRLPELGPIGTFGLANARDFQSPVAAYEDREGDFRLVAKFGGGLWEAKIDHSPLDVVAWRGNLAPYKYDLAKYNCINTVTYDHPDPSIYGVLASPTAVPGTSNVEFACFPPRWSVADHTFRPPPFHRNIASEFMGLIYGEYIGKAEGFVPGSASLHNSMIGHGPDQEAFERGKNVELKPQYLANTMAFMFETQLIIRPTKFALETELLEADYYKTWQGLKKYFGKG